MFDYKKIFILSKKLLNRLVINKIMIDYIGYIKNKNKNKNKNYLVVDYVSSFAVIVTYMHIFLESKKISKIYFTKTENFSKFDRLGILNIKFDFIYKNIMKHLGLKKWQLYKLNENEIDNIFNKLNAKDKLLNLYIQNIKVGDLIYNTYIRWSGEPTISLNSKLLRKIIYEAYQVYYYAIDCFKNINIDEFKYIAGDTAYIYSGITARVAIDFGIKTYSIVETEGLSIVELKSPYYYRNHRYDNYLYEFSIFNKKKQAVSIAKSSYELKMFFNGLNTYSYMKKSSYSNLEDKDILENEIKKYFQEKKVVLIMLHDFMDSPHLYKSMVYPDFYEWIISTLDYLKSKNIKAIIKPHPNGLPENKSIVDKLKSKYPYFYFLEDNTSNKTLLNIGIDFMITVYGSAGYEFAYHNVPVISAGDNPHISFNFVKTCLTENNYFSTIDKFINKKYYNIDKQEIHQFYYMHYLRKTKINLISPIYPTEEFINYINDEISDSYIIREKYAKTTDILYLDMQINRYDDKTVSDVLNV